MDLTIMRNNLKTIQNSVIEDKTRVGYIRENNLKLAKVEEEYNKYLDRAEETREYYNKMKMLLSMTHKQATDFTESRKGLVERTVEENLAYLFPEESFKVKLSMDTTQSGRETCKLLLGTNSHGNIVWAPTTAQNGRFVRQLISVVVSYTLNYLRGSDMVYFDEALASSDKTNLTKLKPLLDRIAANGMQVILIEHKPELYNNVTRREFTLKKDRQRQITSIIDVQDIRGFDDESDN